MAVISNKSGCVPQAGPTHQVCQMGLPMLDTSLHLIAYHQTFDHYICSNSCNY